MNKRQRWFYERKVQRLRKDKEGLEAAVKRMDKEISRLENELLTDQILRSFHA